MIHYILKIISILKPLLNLKPVYLVISLLVLYIILEALSINFNDIENFQNNDCLKELRLNNDLVSNLNKKEKTLLDEYNKLLKSPKIHDKYKETATERLNRLIKVKCKNNPSPNWGKIKKILRERDKDRCNSENQQISNYITKCRDQTLILIKNEIKFLKKNIDAKFIKNHNNKIKEYQLCIKNFNKLKKQYNENKSKIDNGIEKLNKEEIRILKRNDVTFNKLDNLYNNIDFRIDDGIMEIFNKETGVIYDNNIKKLDILITKCKKHQNIYVSLDNYINGNLLIKNKNTYKSKVKYNKTEKIKFYKPNIQQKKSDKQVFNQYGYSYMPPESWSTRDQSLRCKGNKTNFVSSATTGFPYNAPTYIGNK